LVHLQAERPKSFSASFHLTDEAIVYCDPDPEKDPLPICGRLEVAAVTRDAKGDGWGGCFVGMTPRKERMNGQCPCRYLPGTATNIAPGCWMEGYSLHQAAKRGSCSACIFQSTRPETRALCVARIGWHGETDHYLNVTGTVDDWCENVGRLFSGN